MQSSEVISLTYCRQRASSRKRRNAWQINLESGTRIRTAQEKASFYVRIAELYLEDEDPVTAENFCSRAGMVIHDVEDVALCLRYKVCYARILDSKRKFQAAAQKYTELA